MLPLCSRILAEAISIMIESILVRRVVCKNICLNILTVWDTMVSLIKFSVIIIDKTVVRNPRKRVNYWRRTLKTYSSFEINIEDRV